MTDSIEASMLECVQNGDIRGAINAADTFELERFNEPLPPKFFPLLAVCHLIMGDLCGARFALKRSTGRSPAAQLPVIAGLQRVLQCLWDHSYSEALQALANIGDLDQCVALLRDSIILRAVRRAASSTSRKDFSVATCVDVKALNVSVSTVENLIGRAGGIDMLLQSGGGQAAGWESSSRADVLQRIGSTVRDEL
jgi:hypothetical protein